VVVRWRTGRPAAAAIAVSSTTDRADPFSDPAIRLILRHQRAVHVVGAAAQDLGGQIVAELDPRALDVVDPAVQREPREGVHRAVVAFHGARPGEARQVDRGVVGHERQQHELSEPVRAVLDRRQRAQVPEPVPGS
jgi:hypothetical protein